MEQRGNILLVDDNDDDAFFVEKGFQSAEANANIFRCIDGREAQHYLEAKAPFSSREFYPLPDLILLDLKIPLGGGLEVLKWIREHPTLRRLIVIILTSSSHQKDIDGAFALGANGFLTKPSSLAETVELARGIKLCWLKNLPSPRQSS
jgi:CheY-like chemotaxis protein